MVETALISMTPLQSLATIAALGLTAVLSALAYLDLERRFTRAVPETNEAGTSTTSGQVRPARPEATLHSARPGNPVLYDHALHGI